MEREEYIDYTEWFWDTYGEELCEEYSDYERDAYGEYVEDDGLF